MTQALRRSPRLTRRPRLKADNLLVTPGRIRSCDRRSGRRPGAAGRSTPFSTCSGFVRDSRGRRGGGACPRWARRSPQSAFFEENIAVREPIGVPGLSKMWRQIPVLRSPAAPSTGPVRPGRVFVVGPLRQRPITSIPCSPDRYLAGSRTCNALENWSLAGSAWRLFSRRTPAETCF